MKTSLLFFLLSVLFFSNVQSQVAELLSTPYEGIFDSGSQTDEIVEYKNNLYFAAYSRNLSSLWRSDGTEMGTVRLSPSYLVVKEIAATDSFLFFSAFTIGKGTELWISDGTQAGTQMLMDISPLYLSSEPQDLIVSDNKLFFTCETLAEGRELWVSDGSVTGTKIVKDLVPGPVSGLLSGMAAYQNGIVFRSSSPGSTNLWFSDGTDSGTQLIPFPTGISDPIWAENLTVYDSLLYFTVERYPNFELWQTNGTQTSKLVSLGGTQHLDPNSASYFVDQGNLYFFQHSPNNVLDTLRLFKQDANGNNLIELAFFSGNNRNPIASNPTGSKIILLVAKSPFGLELWQSQGSQASTFKVRNLSTSFPQSSAFVADSVVLFTMNYQELWRTNGDSLGTYKLGDCIIKESRYRRPSIPIYCLYQGSFYFGGESFASSVGHELFRTDMTQVGIDLVVNLETSKTTNFNPQVIPINDKVVFPAFSDSAGRELWASDGTQVGTAMLPDLAPGFYPASNPTNPNNSNPSMFTEFQDQLYFSAIAKNQHDNQVRQLFRTDGTASGTQQLDTLLISEGIWYKGFPPQMGMVAFKDKIFTAAGNVDLFNNPYNVELYAYDPSEDSMSLVKNINQRPNSDNWSSYPQHFTVVDSLLFFVALTFEEGLELWKTDGTDSGTQLVKPILAGSSGGFDLLRYSVPRSVRGKVLTKLDSLLIFVANTPDKGFELWRSNGTDTGTFVLKDIWLGGGNGAPSDFHTIGDKVMFFANDSIHGEELWVSDGTALGTFMLEDRHPGRLVNSVEILLATDSLLYFRQFDANAGIELWRSDGSLNGTYMLKDITIGPKNSNPYGMVETDSTVYFFIWDEGSQYQLWQTDGSTDGTRPVLGDPLLDNWYSFNILTAGKDHLYFWANHALIGQSLFNLQPKTGVLQLDPSYSPTLRIFPNPVKEQFTLELPIQTETVQKVWLLNLKGQKVSQLLPETVYEQKVNLQVPNELPNGHYFVCVKTSERTYLTKIVLLE